MSCCGDKRAQLINQTTKQSSPDSLAHFEYIGQKVLTVIGRETHRRYRFDKPGAVVAVDTRDQRALEVVPTLRRVKILAS